MISATFVLMISASSLPLQLWRGIPHARPTLGDRGRPVWVLRRRDACVRYASHVHAGARHLGGISAVSRRDLGAISPQDFYTDATCSGTAVHTRDVNGYATANAMSCLEDEDATSTSFSCRADAKELTAKWCAIPTRSRAPAHRPTRVAHTPIAARLASVPRSCMPPK